MTTNSESCERCRYYINPSNREPLGECHRRAPAPWVIEKGTYRPQVAVWPQVDANAWCGEFQAREREA